MTLQKNFVSLSATISSLQVALNLSPIRGGSFLGSLSPSGLGVTAQKVYVTLDASENTYLLMEN